MPAELCLTLCNPMDCSTLGCSAHGIFHARIQSSVVISSSRRTLRHRIKPTFPVCPALAGRFFTTDPPEKP